MAFLLIAYLSPAWTVVSLYSGLVLFLALFVFQPFYALYWALFVGLANEALEAQDDA